MTNHERFVKAFKNMRGSQLSTQEIKDVLRRRFPGMSEGSMLPNDHGNGNKGACWCAATPSRVFDRIARARYEVK